MGLVSKEHMGYSTSRPRHGIVPLDPADRSPGRTKIALLEEHHPVIPFGLRRRELSKWPIFSMDGTCQHRMRSRLVQLGRELMVAEWAFAAAVRTTRFSETTQGAGYAV